MSLLLLFHGAAARGWDATSISGCKLWLAAYKLALSDGASVTSWPDASGAGHDPTTLTALVYKTAIIENNPVVRFDGTTSCLITPTLANQPITVIDVLNVRSASATGNPSFFDHEEPGDGNGGRLYIKTSTTYALYAGLAEDCIVTPSSMTGVMIFSAVLDGASSSLAINNGTAATGSPGTQPTGNIRHVIGRFGRLSSPTGYSSIDVAEHIVYNRHLTATELTTAVTALGLQYGIVASIDKWQQPTSQPYPDRLSVVSY